MDKPQLPAPLPLVQVQTPSGAVWYIPRAQRHGEFVVQRQYKGTGYTSYAGVGGKGPMFARREYIEPSLVPFLNPGLVQAAGLDMASIMAWSIAHPGQIFSHPTYAALCLRWGDNAHGYSVTAQAQVNPTGTNNVLFTPYTCWLTGITYYQLELSAENQVHNLLSARAGLLPHEQESGLEGCWPGWYVTGLEGAMQVLAEIGYQVIVSCAQIAYGVWVYPESPCPEHWLSFHAVAEEAKAYYLRMPEASHNSGYSLTAMWGYMVQSPGREPVWLPISEKRLEPTYVANLLKGGRPHPALLAPQPLYNCEVAEDESPLSRRVPTLAEMINVSSLSRWQLAQRMGWTPDKLLERERKPWELTLAEIRQLAETMKMTEEKLLGVLGEEIQAWYTEKANAKEGSKSESIAVPCIQ